MRNLAKDSGQTIIEALIAMAAGVTLLTAIAVAVLIALTNAQFSKSQSVATQYAQQAMEYIRSLRNSDYTRFNGYVSAGDVKYCLLADNSIVLYNFCTPLNGGYKREFLLTQDPKCNSDVLVTVDVRWSDQKCALSTNFCHTVELSSCLSDINRVLPPS